MMAEEPGKADEASEWEMVRRDVEGTDRCSDPDPKYEQTPGADTKGKHYSPFLQQERRGPFPNRLLQRSKPCPSLFLTKSRLCAVQKASDVGMVTPDRQCADQRGKAEQDPKI
jgi:hypothetical protein